MLLGNNPAKIDEKGRLKVPTEFRTYIEATWGTSLYITSDSDTGHFIQIYPMPVWIDIQKKLGAMPATSPARRKYALITSYFGKVGELDGQGRILIHPLLREAASMAGEAIVLGDSNRLLVWNHDRFKELGVDQKLTDDDLRVLSEHGI